MCRFLRLALVVHLVAISALAALVPRPAAALQPGGEYTSPNLGFRITWDSSWQVIEEAQIEEDSLLLTNGLGNVLLWGLADFPADLRTCAGLWSSILENDPANGDVALVEEGGDTTSAYAVSAFTRSTDAGALDFQDTFECRVIVPGQSILGIAAVTPAINFEQQRSLVAALLSGLVLVPPGEPGPVFAPDGWRFAVVATLRTGTHFSFDLASVLGQEWLLVVLDASNTLPEAAAFQAEQFGVLLDDDAKAVGLDLDHTTRVASRLRAQTLDQAGVEVAPGQTVRLVLVFQIADSTENIALAWTDASLPLDSGLSGGSNLQGLRPVIAPAPLVPATVQAAIDGQTLAVSLAADGATRTVRLIGVEAPLDEACHAAEATDALAIAEGDAVWLEADPVVVAETDGADSFYVWLEKRDGTLILLNRRLVANGDARAADLPDDARFAAWIADAERSAEAKATGLWAGCEAGDDAGDQDAAEATSEIAGNAAPTAAERAYLTALEEDRDFLNLSLLRYQSLMANPQPGHPDWLNELVLVFTGWVVLSDGAEDRDPPDRYGDLNAAYLAVLEPFDAAAHTAAPNIDDWFTGATDTIDLSGLDLELLQSQVADAEASLGAYVALLDEAVAEAGS